MTYNIGEPRSAKVERAALARAGQHGAEGECQSLCAEKHDGGDKQTAEGSNVEVLLGHHRTNRGEVALLYEQHVVCIIEFEEAERQCDGLSGGA